MARRTLVDRALGALGLQRTSRSRQGTAVGRRGVYAGAAVNRLTADWATSFLSADQSLRSDFRLLRDRARQLERDDALVRRWLDLQRENVVGPTGIALKSEATLPDGSLDRATNAAVEAAWADWSLPETASVDGLLSMTELAELVVARWKADGEALVRVWRGFPNTYGFALQVLDADLLDHTLIQAAGDGTNEIRMGVERDTWGRPVAYHLWTAHPSDYFATRRERVRIPASDIIHIYSIERPGQTRGVTRLAPVLTEISNAGAYQEAEIVAARVGAANTFFVKQTDADGADPDAGADLSMEVEPGVGQRLGPGEDIVQFSPEHPTTAFGAFLKAVFRSIAAGLGVAYSSLTGDLEAANYSSLRDGSIKERDAYKRDQLFIATHLYRRIYGEWLRFALVSGKLSLPARKLDEVRRAHRWIPRGWAWVDPEKDIRASVMSIAAGLDTRTNVCAAAGRDFEENIATLAHEQEIADEAGVTLTDALLTPTGNDKLVADAGAQGATSNDATDATTAGRGIARAA